MGEYPIVSEIEALNRLRNCQVIYSPPSPDMEVEQIELLYLDAPITDPHEYLIPVFKLTGARPITGQSELAVVPAVADEYLETPSPTNAP
jgi:hypothetical protein